MVHATTSTVWGYQRRWNPGENHGRAAKPGGEERGHDAQTRSEISVNRLMFIADRMLF